MFMNAIQLSEYIIRRAAEAGKSITNLKLQKTLYYVQGYALRVFGEPAFEEKICHWQYGPVVPVSYFKYSLNGASPLTIDERTELPRVPKEEKVLYDLVIDACIPLSTRMLVDMTHRETPWRETIDNQVIEQNSIMKYFCSNNPLNFEYDRE